MRLRLKVNGKLVRADLDASETLLDALRDTFNITGPKKGCDEAACGACSVLVDGKAVCSCTMLAAEAQGRSIVTIEGIGKKNPSQLQLAFVKADALQCAFCTPGQVIAAESLLRKTRRRVPSVAEVKEGLSGNLCRCGCYNRIVEAVIHEARRRADL